MEKHHKKHYSLYILKLEQGKYYVGITTQIPEQRLAGHLGGQKTWWTSDYKPLGIFDRKDLGNLNIEEAKLIENHVTRLYIKKYGINNVRGGDLTQTNDMVVRFGYIFDDLTWQAISIIIFLLAVIAYLTIALYFK